MADFPAPVASMIKPPDPNQGISTYSAILGLQQQKQALQTGQYQQQSAQATADQDQQKNAELKAAQQLIMNGSQSGRYANPDGTFNRQKAADELSQVAPTYGQGIASSLLSQANEVVSNHAALQSLNEKQQKQVTDAIAPLASKADVTHEDFINALDQIAQINPATRRMAISMMGSVPPNATPQQLQQIARQAALKATSPEYNAGQSQPNVGLVQGVGTNGQPGLVPTNTNPQAPGGIGQIGPVQQQSVAPGATTVQDAFGRTGVLNPQTNTVTPIGTGSRGQNPSAFSQPVADQNQILRDVEHTRATTDVVAPTNRRINQNLIDLSKETKTGGFGTDTAQSIARTIGLPSGSRYQEIDAYLNRQAAISASAMGVPNTNAGLAAAEKASGSTEYTPQALQEKVKFADALNSGAIAFRQGLDKTVGTGATPDLSKYQAFRSAWAKNFDPDIFRAEDAQRRGDTAEINAIKKRIGPKGVAELHRKSAALDQLENGVIPNE